MITIITISKEERDYLKAADRKIFCTTVGRSKKPSAKTYYAEESSKVKRLLAEFNKR